ncbi:hypothetical protein B9479_008000 [Cryptococcus floricola]|uniref:Uncharacterized protein n=1 Tax=Cryptococcus floricola TaxID=2591691 RepID=A0A5D3AM20_9TREE|nr:hypothetical protein B9479_008000 [Cryptococcus floricola]
MLPLVLLLAALAEARPQGQDGGENRQNGGSRGSMTQHSMASTPTESSASDSSSSSDSSKTGVSTAVIVPVVVVIVLGTILLLVFKFRKWITSKWNERFSSTRRSRSGTDAASRILTADELSGSPSRTNVDNNAAGGADAGNGNRNRRGANGRPRRTRNGEYLRRTESGRSIRTLPVYSKEAGDEELVLVRQRSSSIMSDDTVTLEHETIVEESESFPTHNRTSSEETRPEPITEEAVELIAGVEPESPTPMPHSAPATITQNPDRTSTPDASRHDSITRRGWGEAPTYLEAMSSPPISSPNADLEAGTDNRPVPTLRTRTSSAFKDFLSRAGFSNQSRPMEMSQHPHSSTALPLLQPVTSRISTQSSLHPGTSTYPSPWHSSHSLLISSPIPNTAMRASFDSTAIPRAGLSDDQMRFLSSNEAVNLVGVRMQDPPEGRKNKRRRGSEAVSVLALGGSGEREGQGQEEEEGGQGPPTWEQSEEHRRSLILSPTPGEGEGSGSGAIQAEDTEQRGGASESERQEEIPSQATVPKPSSPSTSSPALLPPAPVFEVEPPTPVAGQMTSQIPSPTIRV